MAEIRIDRQPIADLIAKIVEIPEQLEMVLNRGGGNLGADVTLTLNNHALET